MLLLGDSARDEDAEMADILVHEADNDLPPGLDLVGRSIDVGHPVEGLLRRSDVVAQRGEKNDRYLDLAQIEEPAAGRCVLAGPKLVPHKEVLDDPLDLLSIQQEETSPPPLKLEEPGWLAVNVCVQVVVLAPKSVRRVERLEILDKISTVEDSVAQIGNKRREPRTAQDAAQVAHWVITLTITPSASPIRHRGTVDHDRSRYVGIGSRQHHGGPASLAIADDHPPRAVGVALPHFVHKARP